MKQVMKYMQRGRATSLIAFTMVFALSVAPLALASAQGGPPPGRTDRAGTPRSGAPSREIEQQLQRRIGQIMKERLELTDEQLTRLEGVTRKLERERRAVRGEEFRIRTALRAQLLSGDSASNDVVSELLERMPRVERRRIELMETEQRELAQFLTPIQRARFMGLQEEIRRNMEQIRERRSSDGAKGAPGRPDAARHMESRRRNPDGTPY